jgi:hypothetical protein
MFKVLLALLIVSSSIHALFAHAKKGSFTFFDPILSISSLLSYFPRSLVWVLLLLSLTFIVFVASSMIKR